MNHPLQKMALALLSLALAMPSPASAQSYPVDQGSIILGGTASFTSAGGDLHEDFDGNRLTSIIISPSAEYFIIPNLAVGAALSLINVSQDQSETIFGIGPSASYYVGDESSSAYPFGSVSFQYLNISDGGNETAFTFSAGVAFMVAKNVAITGEAFYTSETFNPEGSDGSISGNIFGVAFGIAAFVF